MSVIQNPGYEEAMTMIANSDSGTATTSQVRPFHMSKLWTALSFQQEEHAENVLRRMQEYMESRKFCDVVLVAGVDGRRVSAHRLILAATSEYFANLFTSNVQSPTGTKQYDSESEEEEELGTTELVEEMCEPEEVIFVGLLRRKGSEEEEQYVTMKGQLRLKRKNEGSSEFCLTGVLNSGNRSDDEEEADEAKCTKNFYNQECKKLEEQEPPHCLALGPGEYFRSYPEIVSQEINSRIVKSIDALCLAAKLEETAGVQTLVEDEAELLVAKDEVSTVLSQPFNVKTKQPKELLMTKTQVGEDSQDNYAKLHTAQFHNQVNLTITPQNKYLDSLLSQLAPESNEVPPLVQKLKSSLKKVECALDESCIVYKFAETSRNSVGKNDDMGERKETRIGACTGKQKEDQQMACQIVTLKDRMRGGGGDANKDLDGPGTTSSIYPQNTEDEKSQGNKKEIQNQKHFRKISRTAKFDIKDNDKPLRLSLRYENKDTEISLTGTLSNKEDAQNDYKLTRLGKELLQQETAKSNEIAVKETLCSKENKDDSKGFEVTQLEGGECAVEQQHVEKSEEFLIQASDKLAYTNWFRSDCSEQSVQFINILPSTSKRKNKEPTSEKETKKFKDALEVWKTDDWKNEEVHIPKPKKPRKDRLRSLRLKFERKDKTGTTEQEEKAAVTKVLIQPKGGNCEKVNSKQGSTLDKIKHLFSTQSSKREDTNAKKLEPIIKQNLSSPKICTASKTSSSDTSMVQQQSFKGVKKVSVEYIAEESHTNKIIPRSWLKRTRCDTDDNNYKKVLASISEEDELLNDECNINDNTRIESEELKLLKSWHCLSSEREKSNDPTSYPIGAIFPGDLDKFDISRKPINNITTKPQDNRTLAELFNDLIKMETQVQTVCKQDEPKDTSTIFDSILRQNLEEHTVAICDDVIIQQKVNAALRKDRKKPKVAQAEVEKEYEILVPQQQLHVNPENTKVQLTENSMPDLKTEADDAEAALVGPKVSTQLLSDIISEIELKIEPVVEEPQLEAKHEEVEVKPLVILPQAKIEVEKVTAPIIPKKKFQLSDIVLEKEISHVSLRPEKLPKQKNKRAFEPKKYWHTPKVDDTSKAKRSKKSLPKEVLLDNVNGNTLELLVNYCYTGNIELQEENTAKNVLATAIILKLKDIVRECTNFLARKLHPSNCLGVVNFAQEQNYQRLFEEAKDYASRHFVEVCKYNEFYELPAHNLAQILSSDELNIPCEEEVFNSIMAWLQCDRENRFGDLPLLLKQMRLPLMQPSFILKYVEPVCALSTPECHRLVIEAIKWHLLPSIERQSLHPLPPELAVKPRKIKVPWSNNVGKLLAVGYNISEKTITLESFAPGQNKWSIIKRKRLLPGRRANGVAIIDNKLLIIGGYEDWDGAKALNTVLSLDMQSLNWTLLQPMNECRYGSSVVVLNGFVYVIGGGDYYRTQFLRSVERWDSETYTWTQVASMKTKRIYAGAVALGNLLYVVGGSNEGEYLSTLECYDPYRDVWSFKASMYEPRAECGVAAAHGYIYVVGGFANGARSRTVERYNPITDCWSRVCSLETARSCCACTALGNRLLTLGGYDEIGVSLHTAEEYNINVDHWEPFPSMTARYFSLFVITVVDKTPKTAKCFKYGEKAAQSNKSCMFRHCTVKD